MDFDTGSDPLLAAAVQIGAGALVLSLALLGVILLLRLRLIARLAHQRRFARRWYPVIAASVAGIPVAVPKLAPKDGVLFLSHWLGAQEALRGGAQRNLNELAAKVGADRLAVRFLGSGNPRTEMLALVALGHLQLQSAWPLVESLAAAAPPAISIAAAQAMLRIDSRRALARVLELTAGREDWPLGQVATMLRECDANHTGPALAVALDAEWHQAPNGPGLARLLHLLGTVAAEASRSTVRNVLKHSSRPEVIAAALGTLWNPEDGGHARASLSHAEWYVRLAAVKALGRIGGAADVDLLSGMLSDPNWWVRYRAAKALVRLPGMNAENLERMRASADDRYAADMLGQVLSALEPQ